MLDVAKMAVDAARSAGADLADARAGTDESESLTVRNQEMEGIDRSTSTGSGSGCWWAGAGACRHRSAR